MTKLLIPSSFIATTDRQECLSYSGAIAVPINIGLRLDDQPASLRDSTPKLAFVELDLCNKLLTVGPEELRYQEQVCGGRGRL